MNEAKDPHEERLKQLLAVQRLATRLPWLALGISLIAFTFIFLEILLSR